MRTPLFLAAAVLLGSAASLSAQSDEQVVTFEIQAINEIAITGTPSLTINAATAGQAPDAVTNSGSSWAITTNEVNKKVTASLDAAMPTGVTLKAQLAAPSGATSAGSVALGTAAVDVVTGISKLNASGLGLSYNLAATSAAGVVESDTRTVTYTIVSGS
jgi:hypothetical protein